MSLSRIASDRSAQNRHIAGSVDGSDAAVGDKLDVALGECRNQRT
jgi:hypothetical protein